MSARRGTILKSIRKTEAISNAKKKNEVEASKTRVHYEHTAPRKRQKQVEEKIIITVCKRWSQRRVIRTDLCDLVIQIFRVGPFSSISFYRQVLLERLPFNVRWELMFLSPISVPICFNNFVENFAVFLLFRELRYFSSTCFRHPNESSCLELYAASRYYFFGPSLHFLLP